MMHYKWPFKMIVWSIFFLTLYCLPQSLFAKPIHFKKVKVEEVTVVSPLQELIFMPHYKVSIDHVYWNVNFESGQVTYQVDAFLINYPLRLSDYTGDFLLYHSVSIPGIYYDKTFKRIYYEGKPVNNDDPNKKN